MKIEILKKKTLEQLMTWLSSGEFNELQPSEQKKIRLQAEKKYAWLHAEETSSILEEYDERIKKGQDMIIEKLMTGLLLEDCGVYTSHLFKLMEEKAAYCNNEGWLNKPLKSRFSKEERLAQMRAKEAQYV